MNEKKFKTFVKVDSFWLRVSLSEDIFSQLTFNF